MRLAPALAALPMSPESNGKKRNSENVPHVERAHRYCAPLVAASHAVVIAKCNPLRPEMVSAPNNEHDDVWT
jgi:hypothetical protein